MFRQSWAKSLVAGAAALLSSTALLAAPVTVGFEGAFDIIGADAAQYPSSSYTEQGVQLTLTKDSAFIGPCDPFGTYVCPTGNASDQLQALNNPSLSLSASGSGHWFRLDALDAAFLPNDVVDFQGLDLRLSVTGQTLGGGTLSRLLGLVESATTPNEFEFASYAFASSWDRLTSVTISACLFDGSSCVSDDAGLAPFNLLANDLQFALDNITVDIPEPSAAWLVALSLGALVATRRQTRAR